MQNMQKQMKNVQSLHNWQFQSLKFQILTKLVPDVLKQKKSQPKVFKSWGTKTANCVNFARFSLFLLILHLKRIK